MYNVKKMYSKIQNKNHISFIIITFLNTSILCYAQEQKIVPPTLFFLPITSPCGRI